MRWVVHTDAADGFSSDLLLFWTSSSQTAQFDSVLLVRASESNSDRFLLFDVLWTYMSKGLEARLSHESAPASTLLWQMRAGVWIPHEDKQSWNPFGVSLNQLTCQSINQKKTQLYTSIKYITMNFCSDIKINKRSYYQNCSKSYNSINIMLPGILI